MRTETNLQFFNDKQQSEAIKLEHFITEQMTKQTFAKQNQTASKPNDINIYVNRIQYKTFQQKQNFWTKSF